jgi:predicted RNase H-like nuclease (RuvC/YqgF family)
VASNHNNRIRTRSSPQSELELLQYQNQSLSTLLKEKKEEISSLRTKLRTIEGKERESNNGIAFITQHWHSVRPFLETPGANSLL